MGIEIRPLIFNNLLVYKTSQLKEDWQESYYMMEDFTLAMDLYKNGPIFFSVTPVKNEEHFGHFTYYLPISAPVNLSGEKEFSYQKDFRLSKALCLRQADQELDFYTAHQKVIDYARHHNIDIADNYYCVLLEVYDEIIIDLYVPIKGESENDL